jgi:hypothetical protein
MISAMLIIERMLTLEVITRRRVPSRMRRLRQDIAQLPARGQRRAGTAEIGDRAVPEGGGQGGQGSSKMERIRSLVGRQELDPVPGHRDAIAFVSRQDEDRCGKLRLVQALDRIPAGSQPSTSHPDLARRYSGGRKEDHDRHMIQHGRSG